MNDAPSRRPKTPELHLSNPTNETSQTRPSWAAPTPAVGSVSLPGPTVRREDVPLHEDVRWLAAALGRVILRLEGQEAFDTIETLRRACRARRHGDPTLWPATLS